VLLWCLASVPPLAERMRKLTDHVVLAPNVADTYLLATAPDDGPLDPGLASLTGPRILFVGAAAARKADFDQIAAIATARPGWSVVLVGPVALGDPTSDVSALAALPNLHLLGVRRQEELPAILRGADAGLIPYRSTRLTASTFSMKLYEFLSALTVTPERRRALSGAAAAHSRSARLAEIDAALS
jgi:glycosyltransferase involved in cell wall biosynthesis